MGKITYKVDDASPRDPRGALEANLRQLELLQKFSMDQVALTARWLTASILAVNGAGAIAVFNALQIGKSYWTAGLLFILGGIASLLSGVLLQDLYKNSAETLGEIIKYQIEFAHSGIADRKREEGHQSRLRRVAKLGFLPAMVGWIGGILFVAGVVCTMFYAEPATALNARRCLAIQADMLSAKPKRQDDVQIFNALHCDPQGDGGFQLPVATAKDGAQTSTHLHGYP